MNPRNRRLVLPALLVLLILVVVVASLTRRAQAATAQPATPAPPAGQLISQLADPRISESSGLAISRSYPGLVYTLNDSGHAPVVYAVDLATGKTVGTTSVDAQWQDTEALGVDGHGTLWVADIGDNETNRDHVSLYALREPGPGTHRAAATEYPLKYVGGSFDAETLLVDPTSDAKWIVTKQADGGQIFPVTGIAAGRLTTLKPLKLRLAAFATDGSVTPDGRLAVVRTGTYAFAHDIGTWALRGAVPLPAEHQGEGLTVEASGATYLIDSEGLNTPVLRMPLQVSTAAMPLPRPKPEPDAPWPGLPWVAGGLMVVVAGAGVLAIGRRSVR